MFYTRDLKRHSRVIVELEDGKLDVVGIHDVYTNDLGERMFELKGDENVMIREKDIIPYCNNSRMIELDKERQELRARLDEVQDVLKANHLARFEGHQL